MGKQNGLITKCTGLESVGVFGFLLLSLSSSFSFVEATSKFVVFCQKSVYSVFQISKTYRTTQKVQERVCAEFESLFFLNQNKSELQKIGHMKLKNYLINKLINLLLIVIIINKLKESNLKSKTWCNVIIVA